MGFGVPLLLPGARWALTRSPAWGRAATHLAVARTISPLPEPRWGHRRFLSVPLSVASRRPAVSRHPALRSPDFPLYL